MRHQENWLKEGMGNDLARSISSIGERSWGWDRSATNVGEEVVEDAQVPDEREGFEVQQEVEDQESSQP